MVASAVVAVMPRRAMLVGMAVPVEAGVSVPCHSSLAVAQLATAGLGATEVAPVTALAVPVLKAAYLLAISRVREARGATVPSRDAGLVGPEAGRLRFRARRHSDGSGTLAG
jgi:hypothetical protein